LTAIKESSRYQYIEFFIILVGGYSYLSWAFFENQH